ncbi:MAG: DUF3307 domain-containing protein [Anaerolineae bacterium]|nr:DUF3307 domain-containing protein [Anaerolineae bacterium]
MMETLLTRDALGFSIHVATQLMVWGTIAHMVTDWLLQTDWMAINKKRLTHPAAWVHGAICAAGMLFVFDWPKALLLGVIHMLIDTGKPIAWWCRVFKHIQDEPVYVKVWADQVLHVVFVALFALLAAL